MLTKILDTTSERYAVYYVVYGSLAGEDCLVKPYFWAGPYQTLNAAFKKAEELKSSYQDDSFIVMKYLG
ncbi:MAG TPA: hypothetical protein DD379_09875 [Cyanobacteria bacterium UBA11162]|nr:hypothetical protein [Cyanobacteria bacterium UBA11370]HBL11701.1 hypothetical protein [Cyanobacteria bacterium UBA11162]HBY76105.1 hypothetical protein [Cyanobacteria bacterium UBA11148]